MFTRILLHPFTTGCSAELVLWVVSEVWDINNGDTCLIECYFTLNINYCQCYPFMCCLTRISKCSSFAHFITNVLSASCFVLRVLPPSDWVYLNRPLVGRNNEIWGFLVFLNLFCLEMNSVQVFLFPVWLCGCLVKTSSPSITSGGFLIILPNVSQLLLFLFCFFPPCVKPPSHDEPPSEVKRF